MRENDKCGKVISNYLGRVVRKLSLQGIFFFQITNYQGFRNNQEHLYKSVRTKIRIVVKFRIKQVLLYSKNCRNVGYLLLFVWGSVGCRFLWINVAALTLPTLAKESKWQSGTFRRACLQDALYCFHLRKLYYECSITCRHRKPTGFKHFLTDHL
jgi:hypothetical protein